jgi:pimeloyl-ACP methyl ester carboxylesterase
MLLKKSAVVSALLICLFQSIAQAPTHKGKFTPFIDDNINGFWEYLPRNYVVDATKRYPLIIFIHGSGEQGSTQDMTTLNLVLRNGPPRIISNGTFPDSFNVKGHWFKFIVISPQIKLGLYGATSIISPSTVEAVIRYAKSAYRVDTTMIYLTGLSMGGGATWDYAGSSLDAASRLAAIVLACGAGDVSPDEAYNIWRSNLPVLATHNWDDPLVAASRTQASVANINAYTPAMRVPPRTIFWPTGGHNAWRRTFENITAGSTSGGNVTDTLGINVYSWMLQFNRLQLALPVEWKSFLISKQNQSVALEWILSQQESVAEYQVEKSKDARAWKLISTIPPITGRNDIRYEYVDASPGTGKSFYRIIAIDANGTRSYSVVRDINMNDKYDRLSIYPNPFIQNVLINLPGLPDGPITVTLADNSGKLIDNKAVALVNHRATIDGMQNLPSGIYHLSVISSGKQLYHQQIVKK